MIVAIKNSRLEMAMKESVRYMTKLHIGKISSLYGGDVRSNRYSSPLSNRLPTPIVCSSIERG